MADDEIEIKDNENSKYRLRKKRTLQVNLEFPAPTSGVVSEKTTLH